MTTGGLPDPGQLPEGDRPRLTPREQAIYEELGLIDSHLAGLFEQGILTLRQVDRPGNVYILAHIGRELSLGVISALTAQGVAGQPQSSDSIPDDETGVLVIASALGVPAGHPLAKAWHAAYRDLVSCAHHRRDKPPPSADQVMRAFSALTDMLFGRIAPYFQTQSELDALLAIDQPQPSHVERLKGVLLRPTQRAYFFRRLTHAGWLPPLLEAKLFAAPPDASVDAAGTRYSWTAWPEGDYLVRMAAQEPQLVFEALHGIPRALRNPVVWYNAAQAAAKLPPGLSRQLVSTFSAALDGPVLFLFPRALLNVAVKLADDGERATAFELAGKLTELGTREGGQRSAMAAAFGHNDVVLKRIDQDHTDDLTERLFPALERADPLQCLHLLARRTAFAIRSYRIAGGDDAGQDYSWSWCEDLERGDRLLHDLRAIFLRATAGLARRHAARGREEAANALSVLERYNFDAFRRLKLYVLVEAGALFTERIDAALSDKELIDGRLGHREYGPLVRRHFGIASPSAQVTFVALLTAGPDRERTAEWLQGHLGRPPTEDEVGERIQRWQAARLAWFGDGVPEPLRGLDAALAPLVKRIAAEEAAFGSQAAVISGERFQSPLTLEQMREMSAADLVGYLRTWSPTAGDRTSPAGLARVLTELVAGDPERATPLVRAIRELTT